MLFQHSIFHDTEALKPILVEWANDAHNSQLCDDPSLMPSLSSSYGLRLKRMCITKPEQMSALLSGLNVPARELLKEVTRRTGYGRCLMLYDMSKDYWNDYISGRKTTRSINKFMLFFQHHAPKDFDDLSEETFNEHFVVCEDCGVYEAAVRSRGTNDHEEVCRSCIDDHYLFCDWSDIYVNHADTEWAIDSAGEEIRVSHRELENSSAWSYDEDRDMYVHEDWQGSSKVIHSYHSGAMTYREVPSKWVDQYRRESKVNGLSKSQYFGVELEVECDSSIYSEAKKLHKNLTEHTQLVLRRLSPSFGYDFFKFERDGSLSNGWEIITQPAGLDVHRAWWQWLKHDTILPKSLSSETATSCGLHIHVNKSSMSNLALAKLIGFVNSPNNASLISNVARRYNQSYAKIKNQGTGKTSYGKIILNSPFDIYKSGSRTEVLPKSSADRYDAINITNQKTIEFRLFQGTLSYPRIIAALEFVYSICRYCHDSSGYGFDLSQKSFLKFINSQPMLKETQTLRSYIELNERI